VAAIDPRWIEPLAGTLVKRSYSDPHWSQKGQAAFCYERVTLFGLVIVPNRRIALASVDPLTARELLIERGMVEGQLETRARFWRHNQRLSGLLQEWCARARRRDLLVDPLLVQRFYEQRLPMEVTDNAALERYDRQQPIPAWTQQLQSLEDIARWFEQRKATATEPRDLATLFMTPDDLLGEVQDLPSPEAFPRELAVAETKLPLVYRFEPGQAHDGVTLTVPRAALGQLSEDRLGWLVPGLLEDKLTALIKALPKRLRRQLVPSADVARQVAEELLPIYSQAPFMPAVCQRLSKIAGESIRPIDFSDSKLPEHLQFLVRVVDDAGQPLAESRDIAALQAELLPQPTVRKGRQDSQAMVGAMDATATDEPLHLSGLQVFPTDGLPVSVARKRGGLPVTLFPALVDRAEKGVDRVLVDDRHWAEQLSTSAVARLYSIAERKELRRQLQWLPELPQIQVKLARIGPPEQFRDQLQLLLARLAFVEGEPLPRTVDDFEIRRIDRARRIADAAQRVARWLPGLADAYHHARLAFEELKRTPLGHAIADISGQLDRLVFKDFLTATPWAQLEHVPRYLRGIAYRIEKLRGGAKQRDEEATALVRQHERQLETLQQTVSTPIDPTQLAEYRWAIEELRVSLFAQPLGTVIKVSPQRLDKLHAALLPQ
jgi:ATP-dependent helicase HrpA